MAELVLNVMDVTGVAGTMAAAVTSEIHVNNVKTMVRKVLHALQPSHVIRKLNILDHGLPDGSTGDHSGLEIGRDEIYRYNFSDFEQDLLKLKGKFATGGCVHLQHCLIGQNQVLLLQFAKTFDVPVYAGTGRQNGVLGMNWGSYVRADPGGTFDPSPPKGW
jgi:hypothetical protein